MTAPLPCTRPGRSAWRPRRTEDGSWTLAHPVHGETCHSLAGAWQQARERYAGPCRLRALALSGSRVVRLLDVGTGIGLNLAAALEALDGTGSTLEVATLERDPDVIRAGNDLPPAPEEARRWHAPVRAALARALSEGRAAVPGGTLELHLGDARATIRSLSRRFDAVFLDPFSPRVEPDLWQAGFLCEVALRMERHAVLSTYSSAFAVRVALAAAGLGVGRGPRVGRKASGTLASPAAALPPLEPRTLRRLASRSPAPNPPRGERTDPG